MKVNGVRYVHQEEGASFRDWFALLAPLVLIAALALVGKLLGGRDFLSPEHVSGIVRALGWKGPLFLAIFAVVTPVFFIPRWPVAFAAGLLYGLLWGGLLANAASTVGAIFHYLMARTLLAPVAGRIMRRYSSLSGWVSGGKAFFALVLLRAFPFSNFSVTNMLAGAVRMPLLPYAAGSFLGMIPSTLLYAAWGKCVKQPSFRYQAAAWIVLAAVIGAALLIRNKIRPPGRNHSSPPDGIARGD